MAEPATQSPFISSSAGGGSSEPGGRDLKVAGSPQSCADSFVSSSQPVSLFSTSQAGAQVACLTQSENQRGTSGKSTTWNAEEEQIVGEVQGRVCGTSESLAPGPASVGPSSQEKSMFSVGSKIHSHGPAAQAGCPGFNDVKANVSAGGPSGPDQLKEPAFSEESTFALLTDLEEEPAGQPHSSTAPTVAGEATGEKDSPESPFEVIADKLDFDKEFRGAFTSHSDDIGSNWVVHSERELLTDIPEDSVCEFQVKPRAGSRVPSGPGLSRQSSGTTAALEEVSKCVREMHSFTSELLSWDLIPRDLNGKPDDDFVSSGFSAAPTKDTNHVTSGPAGGNVTFGKAPAPHQPLTIILRPKGQPSPEAEEQRSVAGRDSAAAKTAAPAPGELQADACWPNPALPEIMDADSSGESDDTVIEDPTVEPTFQNEKAAESSGAPTHLAGCAEKGAEPSDDDGAPDEPRGPRQGGGIPPRALECKWGTADGFEAVQAKADALGGSPVAAPQPSPRSTSRGPAKAGQDLGTCQQDLVEEWAQAEHRPLPPRGGPPSLPLDSLEEAMYPDTSNGESFMDFMKECLKSKGSESPEDSVETFTEAELKAARSEVAAPRFPEPPKATQDLEQERLTIKALKEVGRKMELEKPRPPPSKASPPGGWCPGKPAEMSASPPAPAQKSALEKRPLCLEQAVDVKLAPACATLPAAPSKPSPALPPGPPAPCTIVKILAKFSVHDLIFWRDVKKTGLVFSTTLILLLSLAAFSVISVASYLILALLSVTISFRVYKSVIQAVQKSDEGHPFKAYLDADVALSSETFHKYVNSAMVHVNHALKLIMRLFLVEDLVDSLKLAVVMWLMTYVGAIFNGITLLILGELLVFSVPVVYEKYKTQIDHYIGIARSQVKSVVTKIQAKVPGVVKKKPE
ncbi:reticulon-3 isoform X1 [Varanus komodoensis]|uniref:reticulon-3 isoform X1 n=1 Tax=Varanus komodoensis TaxID=61221 RepID=UPI001CF7C123|nr:reticulon-3 isoform X1 [Varanus komodoensis]